MHVIASRQITCALRQMQDALEILPRVPLSVLEKQKLARALHASAILHCHYFSVSSRKVATPSEYHQTVDTQMSSHSGSTRSNYSQSQHHQTVDILFAAALT